MPTLSSNIYLRTLTCYNYIQNIQKMLNFASLFNQFRSQSNSGINDLLDQPTTKITRLLDEESFLNEYKSGNSKVAEFMRYEKFQELIELITVVGPPQDKKRSYKFPLSACELLSIDNNLAVEFFFPDRPITLDEKVTEEVEVDVEVEVEQIVEVTKEKERQEEGKETEGVQEETKEEDERKEEEKGEGETQEIEVLNPATVQAPAEEKTTEKRIRKEIRKETRKVQKVVKKEVQPLINKLISYFQGEVNYTLAGYVSKVLSLFFTKKPAEFHRFFLQEKVAEKVLNHAESRSVGELITKVLVNETTLSLDQRKVFFKGVLNRLSSSGEIYILSNLSAYVCEIIQKAAANLKGNNKIAQFNDVFFSLDVITQVIKNVISEEQNVSIYNAPILFTYLTSVPFILPEDEAVIAEFKKLLEHFVEKSCEKLTVTARSRPKLGTGRIKIIEILRFILKENIINTREIVAKSQNFFPILINLFREYPLNNLLHNEIIKIIEIALSQAETSSLNASILKDNLLLTFISQEVDQDKKIKAGASVYKARKGFIAHLINLAMKLREVAESNPAVKRAIEATDFSKVYQSFIEKEVFNSKKSLAGFSMRKDIKHEIMFQKEDIIAAHVTFLQKCPSPVFQLQPEQVNIEHPDLVEQLQKQLEQNLTVKPKEEEKSVDEVIDNLNTPPAAEVKAAEVINPSFWVVHLEYNVEDLMIDL